MLPVGGFPAQLGWFRCEVEGKFQSLRVAVSWATFCLKLRVLGLGLEQCSTGTSFLNMFQLGLDPFVFFLILKFKFIAFEKTKFKFKFIDFEETKSKFIDFEETKFKFKFIDFVKTKFKFIDFEKTKFKFIDFEKTKFKFKFMKSL